MNNEFRKASDVLNALFSGFDAKGLTQASTFIQSWKEVAGDKISAHSKVLDVDRGNIVIEVDHPGWSQQILYRKKQMLTSLSRAFPELEIKNIIIRVSTECKNPYARTTGKIGEGLAREAPVRIKRAEEDGNDVPDVEIRADFDDEMKDIFTRLKNSIKKGKPV